MERNPGISAACTPVGLEYLGDSILAPRGRGIPKGWSVYFLIDPHCRWDVFRAVYVAIRDGNICRGGAIHPLIREASSLLHDKHKARPPMGTSVNLSQVNITGVRTGG